MSTGATVAIVVGVLVLLALLALLLRMQTRRRHLQERFGPEYDRTVQERESRRDAERELASREKRYGQLDIRPLSPAQRDSYTLDWKRVQERFVDTPDTAVSEADRLVTALMGDRGYPTEGFDQQAADLSVAHARTLEHYRIAHDINGRAGRGASTEDLRLAMVHYRALFEELLGDDDQVRPDDRDEDRRDEDRREHLPRTAEQYRSEVPPDRQRRN